MNHPRASRTALAAGLALVLGLAAPAGAEQPADFAAALALAAETDQPLVLDFFTEW